MGTVLVTGGTGTLGRPLVERLALRGHSVRVLSRQPNRRVVESASIVAGDVRTGVGLTDAIRGVEVVVHAATSPVWRARATEVIGTRNVFDAARAAGAHLIYVSIIGVVGQSFPYYRSKWAAEQALAGSGVVEAAWTIQRISQFHQLLDRALQAPVVPAGRAIPFQPIDAGEAAAHVADLVDTCPQGRAADLAGPERLTLGELAAIRQKITGHRTSFLPLPVPGIGWLRGFRSGLQLPGEGAELGTRTWADFQRASPELT